MAIAGDLPTAQGKPPLGCSEQHLPEHDGSGDVLLVWGVKKMLPSMGGRVRGGEMVVERWSRGEMVFLLRSCSYVAT